MRHVGILAKDTRLCIHDGFMRSYACLVQSLLVPRTLLTCQLRSQCTPRQKKSNIKIGDFQGILNDKIPTRFDDVAHQRREYFIGGDGVFDFDLQQSAVVGV